MSGEPRAPGREGGDPAAVDLAVRLGPLALKNPIVTASGTFGYGVEFQPFLDLSRIGGLVVKGLSLAPRAGNPPPRIFETRSGMLNAIGLQNVGVDRFLAEKLPPLRDCGCAVIANVFGETLEEYAEICRRLDGAPGLAAVELNVSCPNTDKGGMEFGVDPPTLFRLVESARAATRLPLIVKLSPNVTDIRTVARAAADAGADILSLINTLTALAVDAERRRPVLANRVGGLSGPAVKPVALYLVHRVSTAVTLPIMGMGGIMTAVDAVEFMLAGAAAVQVGTANYVDPAISARLVDDLAAWCARRGVSRVADLTGAMARESPEPAGGPVD
jgi:dihydroorotate dehydrogenase (NAD+) catalytic subunit